MEKALVEEHHFLIPTFGIYRKEHFSGVSIHATSYHPPAHKLAAVNSAIHRLVTLPLTPVAAEVEAETIKYIAILNGLKSIQILSLIHI